MLEEGAYRWIRFETDRPIVCLARGITRAQARQEICASCPVGLVLGDAAVGQERIEMGDTDRGAV